MAASVHLGVEEVGLGVNGSGVRVRVGGTSVGTVKPGFVGGRVEVTKRGGAFVCVKSCESVTQEVNMYPIRMNIKRIFLFIRKSITYDDLPAFPIDHP
jgi:hypothetical protein